jgi:tRNA-splicing ligase RtcB
LGTEGKIRISDKEMDEVLTEGAHWAVKRGFGLPHDLEVTEETGRLKNADPSLISSRAKQRGTPQSGTLGSGNHFLEVQVIREIYDKEAAKTMGINDIGQVLLLIHTGSRGFGHQTCEDYLKIMIEAVQKYNISLPDRQLVCAPVESKEGKDYLSAMACAANYAWANRQCIAHWVRESFIEVFGKNANELGLEQVYDVAHNIAKIEEYMIDGKKLKLCVHRKGATRSFPPGHPDIPQQYKNIGQPVLVPGDMGRRSYIALGTEKAMTESFGSTCHGAGRMQSRGAAKRSLKGVNVAKELEARGIIVKAANMRELAEEASQAYKDVAQVVEVTHKAGISRKVAMAEPMGVVKG